MTEEDQWGITPDSDLAVETTELQELYLNRRWRRNGDPRITAHPVQPPAPSCAGDPQLQHVLEYLQSHLAPAD